MSALIQFPGTQQQSADEWSGASVLLIGTPASEQTETFGATVEEGDTNSWLGPEFRVGCEAEQPLPDVRRWLAAELEAR